MVLLVGGLLVIVAFGLAYRLEGGSSFGQRFDVGLRAATAIAAVIAGLLTWARLELSRRDHHLSADEKLTERFGRAVEQLGSRDVVIRVGGILAMERFALDAAARAGDRRDVDWRMALDLLAAFARETSPFQPRDESRSMHQGSLVDVAEAVRVLGRFTTRCALRQDVRYDLHDVDLAYADLEGVNLSLANLEHANLRGVNLKNSDLTGVDLRHVNLDGGANLEGSDLRGANLESANLDRVTLRNARLHGVNLSSAHLGHANLAHANLEEANLAHARLESALLEGAVLDNAYLRNAQLQEADLRGASLVAVDLRGVNLEGIVDDSSTIWP